MAWIVALPAPGAVLTRAYKGRTVRGPLFTLASYPLAWLSAPAGLWIIKGLTGLASLGCVWLVFLAAAPSCFRWT